MQQVLIPTAEEIRLYGARAAKASACGSRMKFHSRGVMRCGVGRQVKKQSPRLRLPSMRLMDG